MHPKPKIIAVVGPTASGKSALAVEIARLVGGEVVSADSRQLYAGLDIGTGKVTKREMRGIPHHLLDVASPKRTMSVVQYERLATRAIRDILKRGKVPILCGGTGLYIDAVLTNASFPAVPPNATLRKELAKLSPEQLFEKLKRLDAARAKTIDAKNPVRLIRAIEIATALGAVPSPVPATPRYDTLQIGFALPAGQLHESIIARLKKRLHRGMVAETKHLHKNGLSWKRMRELGLEYRALAEFLTGNTTRTEMKKYIISESIHYAKRQMTWFKRDNDIQWFSPSDKATILRTVEKFLMK